MTRATLVDRQDADGHYADRHDELQAESLRSDDDFPLANREVSLVDLLDRLLAGGVVLTGDVTLAIADVDLVRISLRALIVSVRADIPSPFQSRDPFQ